MAGKFFRLALFLGVLAVSSAYASRKEGYDADLYGQSVQDTSKWNQVLYNGRYWRNLYNYNMIKGDQYLFSADFLPGSVSINGRTFHDIPVRYDIYNDEIMIPNNQGLVIQLNKEMVDSFTLDYQNSRFRFANIRDDSTGTLKGFQKVLYKGKSALYVKHSKSIEPLAVDRMYDLFFESYKVYFVDDGIPYQLSGKAKFLKLLGPFRQGVKEYLRKNNIRLNRKSPESFIPAISYYDSIKH